MLHLLDDDDNSNSDINNNSNIIINELIKDLIQIFDNYTNHISIRVNRQDLYSKLQKYIFIIYWTK